MFKKEVYDPTTAPVPGVDLKYKQQIQDEIDSAGDPDFKIRKKTVPIEKPTIIQKIKDIFKL